MSKFSGSYDLYDCIYGQCETWQDKVKAFEKFKLTTGGRIRRLLDVELNIYNIDNEIANINNDFILSKRTETHTVPDKRYKSGVKEVTKTSVIYYGKAYPIDKLKKISSFQEIKFDEMLDLVPYYPYAVAMAAVSSEEGKTSIIISNKSMVEREYLDTRKFGSNAEMTYNYRCEELKKELIETVKNEYCNPETIRHLTVSFNDTESVKKFSDAVEKWKKDPNGR